MKWTSSLTTAIGPYALAIKLGVVAAAASGVALLYHQRTVLARDLDASRKELADVVQVNEAQRAALATLQEQRRVDEQTVAQLMSDFQTLQTRDRQARRRLAELERDNADVRKYLSGAVPAALECVFDDEDCDQGGGRQAPPAGAAPRAVSTP